jgi:hypothetical protein
MVAHPLRKNFDFARPSAEMTGIDPLVYVSDSPIQFFGVMPREGIRAFAPLFAGYGTQ